jgi:hypothetical protein
MAELLAKAKIGTTINSGDIILQIENDGKDPRELAIDIRRALEGSEHGRLRSDRPLGADLIPSVPGSPFTLGQPPNDNPSIAPA